ncbi:MAG: helix-turn-helix transcriptional regulator [Clostridiales bacterium]|nr:helix-turn-helix transcriptional regulator [Clostridiales bacterium]
MAYNETLKALRGNKSQEQISAEIGITKSSWSMYERGERIPRDEIKIRIARYFKKTVEEIFFGNEVY